MINLIEFSNAVATELTSIANGTWTVKPFIGDMDNSWRAILLGPCRQELFLSNTWAGKGRIYIGGQWPASVNLTVVSSPIRPSITVADTTTPHATAKAIVRRLLKPYQEALAEVLQKQAQHDAYVTGKFETAKMAAAIVKGRKGNDIEYVYTKGSTLRVSSKDSIKIENLYLTLDQLRRINAACPELFNPARAEEAE